MTEWDKILKRSTPSPSKKESDTDDFWDVESLLPPRPTRKTPPPPRQTPSAVEIELTPRTSSEQTDRPVGDAPLTLRPRDEQGAPDPRPDPRPAPDPRPDSAVHYVPPHKEGEQPTEPLVDYVPDGVLLHRVKVYGWQSNYHYFDRFSKDAERFAAMKAPSEARKEPFFSYFPQYVQLNRRTAAWYLFWREHVRKGVYPDTDYAYVLLYLFELINLPAEDRDTARQNRDLMAKVWIAYRRPFPRLDHYMCEWLCDYCLIHRLDAPIDLLAPALDEIIMESRLKEFYLSAAVRLPSSRESGALDTTLETARILMRHCCQYDYRKSKFAEGEHKALFDRTIPAAVASVLPLLLGENGQKPAITMLDSTLTRDAYTGALCAYDNKRRIEVSYTSFSRSHELRFLIGDMVKHVENRLRSWLGVRSRLSVMSLPIPLRDALDAYLNPLAPPKITVPVKKKEEPRPAYEALYDLPQKAVSTEDAAAIEAASWETTRILTEAFGETPEPMAEDSRPKAEAVLPATETVPPAIETALPITEAVPPLAEASAIPEKAPLPAAHEPEEGRSGSLTSYIPFLLAALEEDASAMRAAANALHKMPDAIADEINALTTEGEIGDIILEDNGMGAYTVIEDYRAQVQSMLP